MTEPEHTRTRVRALARGGLAAALAFGGLAVGYGLATGPRPGFSMWSASSQSYLPDVATGQLDVSATEDSATSWLLSPSTEPAIVAPGSTVYDAVDVSNSGTLPLSTLTAQLTLNGGQSLYGGDPLTDGSTTVTVLDCSTAWSGLPSGPTSAAVTPTCSGTESTLLPPSTISTSSSTWTVTSANGSATATLASPLVLGASGSTAPCTASVCAPAGSTHLLVEVAFASSMPTQDEGATVTGSIAANALPAVQNF